MKEEIITNSRTEPVKPSSDNDLLLLVVVLVPFVPEIISGVKSIVHDIMEHDYRLEFGPVKLEK